MPPGVEEDVKPAPAPGQPAAAPPTEAAQSAVRARHVELLDRLAITVVLAPLFLLAVDAGGLLYLALIFFLLGLAAWEYARLFEAARFRPARLLLVAGVLLLISTAQFPALNANGLLFGALILAA